MRIGRMIRIGQVGRIGPIMLVMLMGLGKVFGAAHDAGMYWSECYDLPPFPFNWCPDCKVVKQDDGSYMVQDCPDATRTLMAAQLRALSKKNPLINPRPMTDVPPPDDGTNGYVIPDGVYRFFTPLNCPGNNYTGGTNHPANTAPCYAKIVHADGSVTPWISGASTLMPFGDGDVAKIRWHNACTNHPAAWDAYIMTVLTATNGTISTNTLTYQAPTNSMFATFPLPMVIDTNLLPAQCYTNSFGYTVCYSNGVPITTGNPPYEDNSVIYKWATSDFYGYWQYWNDIDHPPGPWWPYGDKDKSFVPKLKVDFAGEPGAQVSVETTTNLVDSSSWITVSTNNVTLGAEGTNSIYGDAQAAIDAFGTNLLDHAFFRLHRW